MTVGGESKKPAAPRTGRAAFWLLLSAALVTVTVAGAAGVRWWPRTPPPVDPPMPAEIRDGEIRLVTEHARQKVLDNPRSADAWGELGMTLLAHLFDLEADRCFAEAARLAPGDARWPYARGIIATKRDPDRAVPLIRQAVAASASWPNAGPGLRLKLAETLQSRQELDEAESLFRDELRRSPGNPRATFGLGLIAMERGHDRAAEESFNSLKSSPFASKKATAQLAALAAARGDATAAAAYAQRSTALPNDRAWPDPLLDPLLDYRVGPRYWDRKATEYEHEGKFNEAAAIYLQQIEENPNSRAYSRAGGNLAWAGDYNRALPLLNEGLRLDPDSAYAHYTYALVHYTRAFGELRQSPNSAQAKVWLAEAVEHCKRAAELKPDHDRAFLYWGLSWRLLGEPAKAVEPLRLGVISHPEVFELQIALGETYLDLGKDHDAETYLENAKRLGGKDAQDAARVAKDFERLKNLRK